MLRWSMRNIYYIYSVSKQQIDKPEMQRIGKSIRANYRIDCRLWKHAISTRAIDNPPEPFIIDMRICRTNQTNEMLAVGYFP